MAEIDGKLAAALKQARKTPMNFAFVAKASGGKLVLSKKRLTAAEVSETKKAAGGGTVFRGRCVGEEGKLVFELAKEPPATLSKQLKTVVTKDGGLTLKVEARKAPDLVEESDEEAPTGSSAPSGPAAPPPGQGAPAPTAPKPAKDMKLKEAVTKRLSDMVGPYKEALAQKGPEAAHLQTLFATLKEHLNSGDDVQAAKVLDQLEPLVAFLAKKTHTEKKIAELEKIPQAAHFAQSITASKHKVAEAAKLAMPPGNDYRGAIAALRAVDTAVATTHKMAKDYQRVLNAKPDTEKKIARLEKHPHKKFITAEITAIKAQAKAALALAEPPGRDYTGALNGLAATDKAIAKAEVTILDKQVAAMKNDRRALRKFLEHTFEERFGISLDMDAKGDTPEQEYEAVRRMYELMVMVPESHTKNNSSLAKIERTGGVSQGKASYQPGTKFLGIRFAGDKIRMKAGRPSATHVQTLINSVNPTPPIDPACQPRPEANAQQNFFDWATLHEIGHAIDDKKGFMKDKGNLGIAGWKEYGSDVSEAAVAASAHFKCQSPEGVEYIKKLMENKAGKHPKKRPATPKGFEDAKWTAAMTAVENWVDSTREGREPWANVPQVINNRVYHEAYGKQWVSYRFDARSQAITSYQFRSHWEWFADLYAAYHMGVLKDEHPMVKKFLRDF
jgi:hypothetical protein